jgi:PAS domain S-box-containing protein
MSRVLIVDDKAENLLYLTALLSAHGHTVEEAHHGAEALGKARKAPPDLIISDLLMPIMDGYTLLRHWKVDERLRRIPFIVYTATYTAPEDERLAIDLGADRFIVKPCEPEDFIAHVNAVIARRLGASPKAPQHAVGDDGLLVEQYSAALVRKLEEKTLQLEAANQLIREESEERRRLAAIRSATLDALPAHIALLDSDGVIVAVNRSWRTFAVSNGLSSPEFALGANYLQVCDASHGEGAEAAVAAARGICRVLDRQIPEFSLEYPCHTDSARQWFRMIVTPCGEELEGGALVTHIDVTEVKLAQEKSSSDAERLALAVEAAGIGIWEWRTGSPMIWDDRMHDLYRVPRGEALDYPTWQSMVHPDDAETEADGLRRVAAAGGKSSRQFRIKTRDGAERYIASIERASIGTDGTIERIVGINVDITERRLREIEVREINTRLETLISEAKIGILVHQNFKPIMANDELARMFGYAGREEILAMPDCRRLFMDDEHARIAAYNSARLLGASAPGFYALKGKKKDGAIVELENRAFPIEWAGTRSVCSMLTDVTEQRKMEAQLRQSQRLEAVGQMTGGIAHDFNNLLTVILGNAELLEEGLAHDPQLRQLADMSVRAAERGADLSHRLLAFSRRQSLDPKAVEVAELIQGIEGLLRRAVGGNVEIRTAFEDNLWRAMIDAPQLESALLNLSVNARDAMPDGGSLTIEAANVTWSEGGIADRAGAEPGEYVMVAVSDTGAGMDEHTKLHAFDPFFTTKEVGRGSGLGLSMIYGFVKQSKGYVQIYSELGHGTTIKLYLPRAAEGAIPFESRDVGGPAPGGVEKVLVVEDDELVRTQVTAQLRLLGYDVVSAGDGIQALELLKQIADFDLLFTDIIMPRGLNGRRLVDEALKLRPGLAVLLTSGYTENALSDHADDGPRIGMLSKPYRRQDLAERVRNALDARKSASG